MTVTYGYLRIRGLGQSIRHLLNYTGTDYVERTYDFGKPPNIHREDWLNEKFTLGLDFPNVPYLKDGDVKLTQSLAILRYIARKHDLLADDEDARVRCDIAEQHINDMMWTNVRLCYNPAYDEQKKETFLKDFLERSLKELERFLGDGKFIAGDKLTYVDFLAYEMLDQHRCLWDMDMYKDHPVILRYIERMENLPKFKAYLKSDKFKRWPVWSEKSTYGGPQCLHPSYVSKEECMCFACL